MVLIIKFEQKRIYLNSLHSRKQAQFQVLKFQMKNKTNIESKEHVKYKGTKLNYEMK